MTYSIRIGFLLAIFSVIFGAGVYLRLQSPVTGIPHQQMAPTFPVTIPGKVPYWFGNLETSDLFAQLTHQASDWKKTITWWPKRQASVFTTHSLKHKTRAISLGDEKTFVDTKNEIINLLWPHAQFHKVVPKNNYENNQAVLKFFGPALDFNRAFMTATTQILQSLWPHSHTTISKHNQTQPSQQYTHDDLFLTETPKMTFSRLTFIDSYVDNKKEMQNGLFPHHYLHIIRPIIIFRTPVIKPQRTVAEGLYRYFSTLNEFRKNIANVVNIAWEFPLTIKSYSQPNEGKIIIPSHRYTFAKSTVSSQSPLSLAPIAVQSAALMGDTGHTQLVLHLSQKPFYIIRTDSTHQTITLAIDNINPDISSIPPLDTTGSAIQNVTFDVTPENQLLVTLTLLPQTEVQGLRYQENNLIVDLGVGKTIPYTQTSSNAMDSSAEVEAQPLIKTPVPLSDNELAQENYNEAVDLLNQGNTPGAIGMLQMLVVQHPNYLDGRLLLANVLLQQNHINQALTVLKEVESRPSIYQSQTYFNLLAEAYRQSGNFKAAITVYQKLLMTNESNGAWWVGLGMCFEGLGQSSAATESYQKALATGSLSPVLQAFVTKKLSPKE